MVKMHKIEEIKKPLELIDVSDKKFRRKTGENNSQIVKISGKFLKWKKWFLLKWKVVKISGNCENFGEIVKNHNDLNVLNKFLLKKSNFRVKIRGKFGKSIERKFK